MRFSRYILLSLFFASLLLSCTKKDEKVASKPLDPDKVPMMVTHNVKTLISDSGITQYRITTPVWYVYDGGSNPRWRFPEGAYLEQFDDKFHINSYIQCDTAYYFDQLRIWKLYGRVRILTKDGLRFMSEQLTWDENKHELSSHVFSKLITPERTLQGTHFWSDEKMTRYYVSNSKGSFEKSDMTGSGASDTLRSQPDSVKGNLRQRATPQRATTIPLMH